VTSLQAEVQHKDIGTRYFQCSPSPNGCGGADDIEPEFLYTDNETNYVDLYGAKTNKTPYVKDAFHQRVVGKDTKAVNPAQTGTKSAAWYAFNQRQGVAPGECAVVRFRVSTTRNDGYLDEE
ncbi:hypothetical protein LTR53_019731, partial [Teratosphaeriaceae sp. CCFEE 6253]